MTTLRIPFPARARPVRPAATRSHDGRLSRGVADGAIVAVVGLIALCQLADWMLGRSRPRGRFTIV